jgi:peptide chain release factor 1
VNERLDSLIARFRELDTMIQDPALAKDQGRYRDVMREHAHLAELVAANNEREALATQIAEAEAILHEEKDAEMREMAREELKELEAKLTEADDR